MKYMIDIEGKKIGEGQPIFIIAEAGVNHNGDLDLAKKLVATAKDAGADCVKFQTFKAENVVTLSAPKAQYQMNTTDCNESQFDMLKKLELDFSAHREVMRYCRENDIVFLSTPYSLEDVELLEELGVCAYKIASGQLVEPAFLRAISRTGKPIILSTGMATLKEVDEAVRTIIAEGNKDIVLLQCTTNYPSRSQDANLRSIGTMASAFGTIMGYSDHTQSPVACLVAVGAGAKVIEKHITLDKNLPGPDHSSSADPREFEKLVALIREAESVLGTGCKEPCEAELANLHGMRRSLVASRGIREGEIICEDMIAFKRPGTGIKPSFLDEVVGRVALRDIEQDQIITWAMCGKKK